jgi:hypothetical protein
MAYLIVEKIFEQPLSEEQLDRLFTDLSPCLRQYQAEWLHSYLSTDRKRMVCSFEAADAESVRMAHRVAGVKFQRVWPALKLTPE